MCSEVFIAEQVDGVGDNGSGETTMVNVRTLLEAFLNLSQRSVSFIDEAFFLVGSKTSSLGTVLLKCQIVRISRLLDVWVKGLYCIYFYINYYLT